MKNNIQQRGFSSRAIAEYSWFSHVMVMSGA